MSTVMYVGMVIVEGSSPQFELVKHPEYDTVFSLIITSRGHTCLIETIRLGSR